MYQKRPLLTIVLAFIFFFMAGWKTAEYYYFINYPPSTSLNVLEDSSNIKSKESIDLSLYWDVWQRLEKNYIDPVKVSDKQNFIYGSIKGLVEALDDPYTVFMTPDETKQFEENLNGSLEGIGAELTVEDGFLVVISPLKDSPAEKAGLLPGDIIFQINGENTSDMTLFEAIMKIRGEKGTEVTLTIIREDVEEAFDIVIVRDEITVESVSYKALDNNIDYISINQFSDNTTEEFDAIVKKVLSHESKGIILDLRYNGGGYLDIAVDILSEFIEGYKPVVKIKTRDGKEDESLYVYDEARLQNIPLVILVNEGSASASEIVAGAIQDHKRGIIMGKQTYGKGSVQEVEMLKDGSSLRITIAKWLTPSGRDIDEVGVTPDRIVELDMDKLEEGIDTQLEEAKTYLVNLD
jgi:carboxyl-terminal processing protease